MSPSPASATAPFRTHAPRGRSLLPIAAIAALHLCALALMAWSERGLVASAVFLLTWGLANFFWLALLRRPAVAAALSLLLLVALILVSRLKYEIVWMTANFLDVWIVNADTVGFLLSVKPDLSSRIAGAAMVTLALVALLWRIESWRVRRLTALTGLAGCLAGLTGVALAFPQDEWVAWFGDSYVSKFSRSGVAAVAGLVTQGYLESDETVTDRLRTLTDATCTPAGSSSFTTARVSLRTTLITLARLASSISRMLRAWTFFGITRQWP